MKSPSAALTAARVSSSGMSSSSSIAFSACLRIVSIVVRIWSMFSLISLGIGLAGEGERGGGIGLEEAGEVRLRLAVAGDLLGHLAAGQEAIGEIEEGLLLRWRRWPSRSSPRRSR